MASAATSDQEGPCKHPAAQHRAASGMECLLPADLRCMQLVRARAGGVTCMVMGQAPAGGKQGGTPSALSTPMQQV